MIQKLNKLKLLLTFSLAGLLLFACQADKDLTNENLYEKNGVIMHKKFEELIKETQFRTAYEKISKPKKGSLNKGSATSRTVMEDQYGFTISDYPANVVVSDSITSYTFLIARENTAPNVFENLIINIKQNQEPSAFILKYESVTSFNDVPFNPNTFQGKRYLNPIEYNPNEYVPNVGKLVSYEVCRTVTSWYCYGPGDHNDHTDCSMGFGIDYEICTLVNYDDGQTGGSSGSDSPGNQHSGGGGVVTAPVVPKIPIQKDPCEILTPLIPEPKIVFATNFLKPKTQTKSEFAFTVTNSLNADDSISINTEFIAGSNASTIMQTGGNIIGCAHNHPSNGQSIPSWGDIRWLMNCELNNFNRNDGTAFNIVVVRNSQNPTLDPIIYAITISDLDALQTQINADLALPKVQEIEEKERTKYMNGLQSDAFSDVQNNTEALEKKFLEYFSKYGVVLSKFDPVLNKWSKLKLKNKYVPALPNAANTVIPEPCN